MSEHLRVLNAAFDVVFGVRVANSPQGELAKCLDCAEPAAPNDILCADCKGRYEDEHDED